VWYFANNPKGRIRRKSEKLVAASWQRPGSQRTAVANGRYHPLAQDRSGFRPATVSSFAAVASSFSQPNQFHVSNSQNHVPRMFSNRGQVVGVTVAGDQAQQRDLIRMTAEFD
jgi:hypothetical protein